MALTRSKPASIFTPEGNSLAVFIDVADGTLKLKDVFGGVALFSDLAGGAGLKLKDDALMTTTLTEVADKDNTPSILSISTESVGIGTTTPIGILNLYKTAATTRFVIDGDAGQSKIITYRTGGLQRFGLYVNNTAESGANEGSDFVLRRYTDGGTLGGTPFFIKRSTGNVGINTTTPATTFDVNGTANIAERLTIEADSTATTQSTAVIQNTTTNSGIALVPNGTGAITADVPDGTVSGGNARGINVIDLQTERSNANQVASARNSVIVGGSQNRVDATSDYSSVLGGNGNAVVGAQNSVIGGGLQNQALSNYSTVSGGQSNTASTNTHATVVGGQSNTASGSHATILGGQSNVSSGQYSISGGLNNVASGNNTIALGEGNIVLNGSRAFGNLNNSGGNFCTAIGTQNTISSNHSVGIGLQNVISTERSMAFGYLNNISSTSNSVAIGTSNVITASGFSFGANNRTSADFGSSFGHRSRSYLYGQTAFANGFFSANQEGFSQSSNLVARKLDTLTTAGTTVLSLDGTGVTNLIICPPNNRMWNVSVKTIAVVTAITGTATGVTVGDSFMENRNLLFKRLISVGSSLVGVGTAEIISDTSMATALMTYTAGASEELALTYTAPTFAGGGSITVRVVSKVELVEVGY